MTISEQLMQDLATSMRSGDAARTGVLRLLRSAFKNEEIKLGHPLTDDEHLKVLQREAKQRRDSIEQYTAGSRTDLADKEREELDIIATYLPQPLSEDEVRVIVDEVVVAKGAVALNQMGMVIGEVMKQVGARAEGGLVSRLVKERLSA